MGQNVEAPALACTLPVLARGLNDKSEEVKRTCCLIVDNMCKVVEDPSEVTPVMPRLEPLVKSAVEMISDPEARAVAEKAEKTLQKAAGDGSASAKKIEQADAMTAIQAELGDKAGDDETFQVQLK